MAVSLEIVSTIVASRLRAPGSQQQQGELRDLPQKGFAKGPQGEPTTKMRATGIMVTKTSSRWINPIS